MNYRIRFLILGFSLSTGLLFGQESLPIRNFFNVDYQAHQQNWAIGQNPEGLIYIGNTDGLLEYDGAAWHLYPFADGQPVRTLLCRDKRIYVGGYGEFGYWEKNSESILQYHSISDTCHIPSTQSEEIWNIIASPEGILFQSFSRIYKFSEDAPGKESKLVEIKGPKNFMLAFNIHNKVLLQLIGDDLFEIANEKFRKTTSSKLVSQSSVSAILPFKGDSLIIATNKHGVLFGTPQSLTEWKSDVQEVIKKDIINKAIRLQNGAYAFGTQLSGVHILSADGHETGHFNKLNGLQNNSVLDLFQDRQQNLWVALDKGIDLVPLSSPVSQYLSENMPLEATYAVALWRNKLYAGTNRGVFWKPWPSSEPFRPLPGLQGHVWELHNYDDQLLCGHSDGTFLITESGVERLSATPGGWTTVRLKPDPENVLLQGTYTGLSVYHKQNNGKWAFSHHVANVPPIPIKHIGQGADGTLWLAHAHKGLYRAKLSDDTRSVSGWTQVASPFVIKDAYNVDITSWQDYFLIKSGTEYFTPDHQGSLKTTQPFPESLDAPLTVRKGLGDDWFRIYPDHITLQAAAGKTTNIPVALIRNNENIVAVDNRYYFFCTHNGYFVFDRDRPETTDETIRPVLRSITDLHDKTLSFTPGENIIIPAQSRAVSIHFFMPVYGESLRFRHKVQAVSPGWSEWTEQRNINLSGLTPGLYTFELENSYNNQKLVFRMEVLPKWHESGWARMGILFLSLVILLGLYYWQERRMREQRLKLTREHDEKLLQKEMASQKRIVELQNEKLASEINLKSQQLSNIAINVIRKNEILESIKTELVEVKKELGQQLPNLHYQKLLDSVTRNLSGKEDWTLFEDNFDDVHEEFFKRLKKRHPDVSPGDLRLAAALRMNLSSKEIAPVLGISVRGVEIKRYRLRKKLGLDEEINLNTYMMEV